MPAGERDVTGLLARWRQGDAEAEGALFDVIYPLLRAIAARRLAGDHELPSLQPTELVHETYLRLVDQKRADWNSREHFFAIAARIMRRVLIDHFRRKASLKRGGGQPPLPLVAAERKAASSPREWLDFDRALVELEQIDARAGRVVELRYYAGVSVEETARALEVSSRTVERDWRFARAFLESRLRESGSGFPPVGDRVRGSAAELP